MSEPTSKAERTRVRAGQILDTLERSSASHGPAHVAIRLAVLLDDEDLLYVDDDLRRPATGGALEGQVVVITPTRVLRAELKASEVEGRSDVTASTWGRHTLGQLDIVPGAGGDIPDNDLWDAVPDGNGWPRGAVMSLGYAGRTPLTLPLQGYGRYQREALGELLPSLLADVALR